MSCVLYGIGSRIVVDYEESCERRRLAIVGAVKNVPGPIHTISDVPVHLAAEIPESLLSFPFIVPIFTPGYRRQALGDAERHGFSQSLTLVDPTATVARSTTVGAGSFVNCGVNIGGAGSIGRFVLINRSASIGHHAQICDFASIGPGAVLAGDVKLGRGAVIGAGAIITPETMIGDNAVVCAGSVVTHDVPANSLVGGQPAQMLRSSIVGYNDLAA
jgi:sugar O-acyltransferase (sialic acid O-acetyltransferase NeuD family)